MFGLESCARDPAFLDGNTEGLDCGGPVFSDGDIAGSSYQRGFRRIGPAGF